MPRRSRNGVSRSTTINVLTNSGARCPCQFMLTRAITYAVVITLFRPAMVLSSLGSMLEPLGEHAGKYLNIIGCACHSLPKRFDKDGSLSDPYVRKSL